MRHTERAIIIQDKKLLVVTGHDADFYWTPGGKVDNGEKQSDALYRELREELGVDVTKAKPYMSYIFDDTQKVDNYIVDILGEIVIGSEITHLAWVSREDFYDNSIKLSRGLTQKLIPQLIIDNLI